jgi:hypothetical protein
MFEWRRLSRGVTPVPAPVATPFIWAIAYVAAPVLVAVLNLIDGQGDPSIHLVVLSLLAALLGLCARLTAAPGTALVCWLFLNGFATPPMVGQLSWEAHHDLGRLACLLVAACAGTLIACFVNARAAYRRVSPFRGVP